MKDGRSRPTFGGVVHVLNLCPGGIALHMARGVRMATSSFEWGSEAKSLNGAWEHYSTVTLFQDEGIVPDEDEVQPTRQNLSGQFSVSSEGTANSDIPQVVPCTFTICLALPGFFGPKGKHSSDLFKRLRPDKLAKFLRYYHIEYLLLPDDREPKQADVVLLNTLIAKVFIESGIKAVSPWYENDKLWVSWKETHKMSITKEVLKKLNYHKIILNIWDTKEKVSKKAKFTKVKSLSRQEDFESVGHCPGLRSSLVLWPACFGVGFSSQIL
ncbi:uncharacterized protein KIAA1257-like [Vombatus ursinus]|uniref:uncharacterized protein KIAA1257-like n=1 Tax=Vombatus ursinus TaxID=29139 RepID=UPI000FFDA2A6|nr:uncharacterized protein KIAA1257-like [Vombatus ursinus]